MNSPGSYGRSPGRCRRRPPDPQEGTVRRERWGLGSEAAARRTLVDTMWRAGLRLQRPTKLDRGSSRRITIMRALPTCRWVIREYQCDSPSIIASLPGSQHSNAPPKGRAPSQERLDRLVHISVPSRKFDEEVLRFWRGRRPHPLPLALDPERTRGALRREVAIDTAECGGEGEELKEAGGRRPPASFKTSPLPRLDSLLRRVTLAGGEVRGGGESLAHSSGSRGAAMKVQVESSPDGISLRTFDTPH